MTDIGTLIAVNVEGGRMLDRDEARSLARAIGAEPTLWQQFARHDANQRNFTQLYRDPSLDVWLICWDNAQDTGYHDHDQSSGAVYVCAGMAARSCGVVIKRGFPTSPSAVEETIALDDSALVSSMPSSALCNEIAML